MTQAPIAHPLTKSWINIVRSNLLVGIIVSFAGDVFFSLVDHIVAHLSLMKPARGLSRGTR
jgi:hypothetical protein